MAIQTKIAFKVQNPGVVVTEHLRYAGILDVHQPANCRFASMPAQVEAQLLPLKDGEVIIIIDCPKGHDAEVWIKQNTQRLASFNTPSVAWKDKR